MKKSAKIKRLRRHRKRNKPAGLNLVSLMDIFTILVFFLLINSGDVEILQTDDSLELPSSVSERTPEDGTLLLMVNKESIIVEGREVVSLDALEISEENEIAPLAQELARLTNKRQASKNAELTERQKEYGFAITIMGDKDTPYTLLKSLIKTCTEQNYRDIALAVNQIPNAGEESLLQPQPDSPENVESNVSTQLTLNI